MGLAPNFAFHALHIHQKFAATSNLFRANQARLGLANSTTFGHDTGALQLADKRLSLMAHLNSIRMMVLDLLLAGDKKRLKEDAKSFNTMA